MVETRLAWWTGGVLAVLAGAAIALHVGWGVSLGRLGVELSTAGLVVQGVALAVGVVAINLVSHAKARGLLVSKKEGADLALRHAGRVGR